MAKQAWRKDAPKHNRKTKTPLKPWHKAAPPKLDTTALAFNDDGTRIPPHMRCIEEPDAGLKRMLRIEGIQPDGSIIEVKTAKRKTLKVIPHKPKRVIVGRPKGLERMIEAKIARRDNPIELIDEEDTQGEWERDNFGG